MTESLATAVIDDRVVVYDLAQPIPVLSANLTIMEVAGKELCLHGDGIHVAVATEGRSIHIDYAQVILCLGSVLVFSVPSWKLKYKIDLADSQSCEEIFISNKVLLVGQQGRNGKSSADYVMIDLFVEMSTVNIYHLIDSDWFLSQTIRGSNVSDFGHSLAVSGALALIGAPNDEKVYCYQFNGDAWIYHSQIEAPEGAGIFGRFTALHGNLAIVSDLREMHIFQLSGNIWMYQHTINAVPTTAMSLSGDRLLITTSDSVVIFNPFLYVV